MNEITAVMTVYRGRVAEGEIEDHGRRDVRAFLGVGDERTPLGTFPTRRDAMQAVSSAARTQQQLSESAPSEIGIPG